MVGTMLPIGYGERLRGKPPVSLMAYAVGSVLGASALGVAIGVIGDFMLRSWSGNGRVTLSVAATGVVAVLYGLSDADLVPVPRPQFSRQVPSSWYKRSSPGVTGLLYGAALGAGIGTRIQVATFYILPVWAFTVGGTLLPAAAFAAFGLGRFLPLALIGVKRAAGGGRLEELMDRVQRFERLVALGSGLWLSMVGALFLASVLMSR